MIGNFVERALFPLLGLREPENPTLEIEHGTLPAQRFLTANFDQPVHALTLPCVKLFPANQPNRIKTARIINFCAYRDAE